MVNDYTVMVVSIAVCVTALMVTALIMGKNGVLVDSYLLFMGGLIGAISAHYKLKADLKRNNTMPPGGS